MAQLVAYRSPKPVVAGSNPVAPAKKNLKQKEKGRSMTDKIANATLDGARQNPFVRARAFVRDVISELKLSLKHI